MSHNPRRRLPFIRNRYFLLADLGLLALAAGLSFVLRLDVPGIRAYDRTLLIFGAAAVLVKPLVFYLFGFYRRYWRYGSANDLVLVVSASAVASGAVALLVSAALPLVVSFRPVPRSIPFIDWLVSAGFVGAVRFLPRVVAENPGLTTAGALRTDAERAQDSRVLVVGTGQAAALIVREIRNNPGYGLHPVGLVTDTPAQVGMTIHGFPVLGIRAGLAHLVGDHDVDEVLIALPAAPGPVIQEIVEVCQAADVACKTVPALHELIAGELSVTQVREVSIEDLLRRDPVRIESGDARPYLEEAVVLITGAGGSIGSELCRQIATYDPQHLLLLGHGENSIYRIRRELGQRIPHVRATPLIADVRDDVRLEALFARHRPQVVFHAAAHKHVPLMERNVPEAVTNNVFGTHSLLRAAERHGVDRFVLISTDKAVEPVNVMGATKRVAELLVQDAARRTGRAYVAVRFGNVLGSRGSVVPLFQRQIAAGGPVTVTHPDMERFFMTIPESVQLVIQAGAIGRGGEIFVLDMGEQVRIVDLVEQLTRLSGLTPGRDVDIVFTGPRPGEKLSEALFAADESPRATKHEKILAAQGNCRWEPAALARRLDTLRTVVDDGNPARIQAAIQDIVPTYEPLTNDQGIRSKE